MGAFPDAKANATRSRVRATIEHIFAHQKHRMGLLVRTIGLPRARLKIGMTNLVYNIRRFLWLQGKRYMNMDQLKQQRMSA